MSLDRHKEVSKKIYQRMSEEKRKFDDSRRVMILQNNHNIDNLDDENGDAGKNQNHNNEKNNFDDNENNIGDGSLLSLTELDEVSLRTPSFCNDDINSLSSFSSKGAEATGEKKSSTEQTMPENIFVPQVFENSQNKENKNKKEKNELLIKSFENGEKVSWPFFSTDKNNEGIRIHDDGIVVDEKKIATATNTKKNTTCTYWDEIIDGNNLAEKNILKKVEEINNAKISHFSTLTKSELCFFVLARWKKEDHHKIPKKRDSQRRKGR